MKDSNKLPPRSRKPKNEPADSDKNASNAERPQSEAARKRQRLNHIWESLQRLYETVGNVMGDDELLELAQKILKVEASELPKVSTLRSRASREKWSAGSRMAEPLKADEFSKVQKEYQKELDNHKVRNGQQIVISNIVDEMSERQLPDVETTEERKARQNKQLEDYILRVTELRLTVRDQHITENERLRRYFTDASELAMTPYDLTDEESFTKSNLAIQIGKDRLRVIDQIQNISQRLQLQEAAVLGLDYEVNTGEDQSVEQAAALRDVRQHHAKFFAEQNKRREEHRKIISGRGERIAESLNKAGDSIEADNVEEILDTFDSVAAHEQHTGGSALPVEDQPRDFTETLPDGGDDD